MVKKLLSFASIVSVLIVVAVLGGTVKQFGKALVQPISSTPQETEQKLIDELENAARELNKNTPKMIDADTRMDATTVGPGLRININYTLPKHAAGEISADQLIQYVRPTLKNYACNKKNMKILMQWGAVIAYSYHAKDQTLITDILIDREDCSLPEITP